MSGAIISALVGGAVGVAATVWARQVRRSLGVVVIKNEEMDSIEHVVRLGSVLLVSEDGRLVEMTADMICPKDDEDSDEMRRG